MAMEKQIDDQRPMKDWVLTKESELRIEVLEDDTIDIKLLFGNAEVFGTELVKSKNYTIPNRAKIAVFTWTGCTLRVLGSPQVVYVSTETPMMIYLNTHAVIDHLRQKAESNDDCGPRVMVCGPSDVGKTTLCRILLNYAVRKDRRPCLVDADVGQATIAIPGTVGILPIERIADIEEGGFSKEGAHVFHYGHNSPGPNLKLFNILVSRLATRLQERWKAVPKNKHSGCIINTCGWVDGSGYKSLIHVAQSFEANVILVLDNERLFNDLRKDLPQETNILRLPKSGGVVARSRVFRRALRDETVREYFYGKRGINSLFPFSFDVKFSDVEIFKIGAPEVPESCLPIGAQQEDGSTQLLPVEPARDLEHSVASLSIATSLDDNLITTSSAGFLCISSVKPELGIMTVLSPAPSPLPRKYLLLSDIKFMDFK